MKVYIIRMEILNNEFGTSIDTTGNDYKRLEVAGIGNLVYINSNITEIDISGAMNKIKFGPKAKYTKVRNMGSGNVFTGLGIKVSGDCDLILCKDFGSEKCIS